MFKPVEKFRFVARPEFLPRLPRIQKVQALRAYDTVTRIANAPAHGTLMSGAYMGLITATAH